MSSAWIHSLTKEQALQLITEQGLDPTAPLDTLRRRLRQHLAKRPEIMPGTGQHGSTSTATEQKRDPLGMYEADEEESDSDGTVAPQPCLAQEPPTFNKMRLMNQIRKWGHFFDGKDPMAFLERTEELRIGYGLEHDHLLAGLSELLRGDALLWYRNHHHAWTTWDAFDRAFRAHFLPAGYQTRLKREIQGRYQRPGEPYQAYSNTVLTLMRRAGGYTPRDKVEQIYENLDPDYQLYITLTDTTTLSDLGARAAQYETIVQRRKERQTESATQAKSLRTVVAAATYNREECCWRCKQRGHTRIDCKRPAKKFCSRCGKDGVLTRDCHPPTGNAKRAGDAAAVTLPDAE